MSAADPLVCPEMEGALWRLYRDFFDTAERKRRWRMRDDIPWNECNPNLDPAIADVVETFCCVELYLPDYVGKVLPLVRQKQRAGPGSTPTGATRNPSIRSPWAIGF